MKKLLASVVATGVILVPAATVMPAALADGNDTPTVTSASDAQKQLEKVDKSIAQLQQAQKDEKATLTPDTDYLKELRDLLETAFELRDSLIAISTGGVPDFDIATIGPRVQLLTTISTTIHTATTDLTNKVSEAHVEIGFAVTKAVIRLINPTSSVQQIEDSIQNLTDTLEKVSQYPDLTPESRATIYVKAKLDKAIGDVRFKRDKNILGKNADAYFALNRAITKAVGVQLNPAATVAQTEQAVKDVNAAYDTAEAAVR